MRYIKIEKNLNMKSTFKCEKDETLHEISSVYSNLNIGNFKKICRICLHEGPLIPIYDQKLEDVDENLLLETIVRECISLDFNSNDHLPQMMCTNCEQELCKIYVFRKRCHQNDLLLREILKESEIKKEKTVSIHSESDNEIDNFDTGFDENNSTSDDDRPLISFKKIDVKEHKRNRKKQYKCKICLDLFGSKDKLYLHQTETNHKELRNHACPECNKLFTRSKLTQHMRSHTKEKPYQCEVCAQSFSLSGNLKRHIKIHTGEKPHVCDICGKGFIQSTSLHSHKKSHVNNGQSVNRERGLETQKFFCDQCGRGFKREAPYKKHLVKHDPKTEGCEDVNKDDIEKRVHICSTCGRSFKTKHLLKAHILTHGVKSFLCNECGKGFNTKAGLQSHLKIHTGEKPHTCPACNKSFAHIGSFDSHMLIHSGLKPHHCMVCKRAFTQLSHLKYHMRTHSGERPYVCSYCGKTFALKGNLTVHVRTHTGETPYLCTVCGKGFYDSSSMKKHKKNHKIEGFDRNVEDLKDEVRELVLNSHYLEVPNH